MIKLDNGEGLRTGVDTLCILSGYSFSHDILSVKMAFQRLPIVTNEGTQIISSHNNMWLRPTVYNDVVFLSVQSCASVRLLLT